MSTAPVIFDITYTPHHLKRGSSEKDIAKHAKERAFFTMTGDGDTIYRYMTREGKICGEHLKQLTVLEYLQKSTGVFNGDGIISKDELADMKFREQSGEKNIWHGFISFDEEHSEKIDTPQKCIELIKRTFSPFFRDAGFEPENIDLMCALHLDRPTHLHVHFCFWEKEPKIKNQRAAGYKYRAKGKIKLDAIAAMTERLNAIAISDELLAARDEVEEKFTHSTEGMTAYRHDRAARELRKLAKELPDDCVWRYGNPAMKPYRERIDEVVLKVLVSDMKVYDKYWEFDELLDKKRKELAGIMGKYYKEKLKVDDNYMNSPLGGGNVKLKEIKTIERLQWDYRRRLGDVVLHQAWLIRKNSYTYSKRFKHKANDRRLRRNILFSERRIGKGIESFLSSLASLFVEETRGYHSRLREIEEEMKADREKELAEAQREAQNKKSKYDWSK